MSHFSDGLISTYGYVNVFPFIRLLLFSVYDYPYRGRDPVVSTTYLLLFLCVYQDYISGIYGVRSSERVNE